MKKLSFFLMVVVTISMSSCYTTIRSTSQVLGSYTTKDQVVRAFGLPSEKRSDGNYTEFYYDQGSVSVGSSYSRSNANASASSYGNTTYGSAQGSGYAIGSVSNYNRYVKFTFDHRDNVISSEAQGVDMAEKKAAWGKTILLLLGSLGLGVGLGLASAG